MAVNPNIQNKANKIRDAKVGLEVRESLASGLEEISKDVVSTKGRQTNVESQFQSVIDNTTGKDVVSAPEILASRVGEDGTSHANLKTRLDDEQSRVNAQLAHKATKEELNKKRDLNRKITSGEMDISSEEAKMQPINISQKVFDMFSPSGSVSPIIPDFSLTDRKFAPYSFKTDNIKEKELVSSNLFNEDTIIRGFLIDNTNGEPYAVGPDVFVTDLIPVKPNYQYITNMNQATLYNIQGEFITFLDTREFYTNPATAYVRLSGGLSSLWAYRVNGGTVLQDDYKHEYVLKGLTANNKSRISTEELYVDKYSSNVPCVKFKNIHVMQGDLDKKMAYSKLKSELDPYFIVRSMQDVEDYVRIDVGFVLVFDMKWEKFRMATLINFKTDNFIPIAWNSYGELEGPFVSRKLNAYDNLIKRTYLKPDYSDAVENKENEVLALLDTDMFSFAYSTDHHDREFEDGRLNQTYNVLNRVSKSLDVDAIVNAGDMISYGRAGDSIPYTLSDKAIGMGALKSVINKIDQKEKAFFAIGNHDYNGSSFSSIDGEQKSEWTVTPNETYNILGRHQSDSVTWGSRSLMYYFKDFEDKKIRIIFLNTSDNDWDFGSTDVLKVDPLVVAGVRQEQATWLANVALNLSDKPDKTEWHTLIVCHVPLVSEDEGMTWTTKFENNIPIRNIIKGFKEGLSGVASYTDTLYSGVFDLNVPYDFSTQGASTTIGIFSGHNHLDRIVPIEGINHITTAAGYADETTVAVEGGVKRQPNTYSEVALDVVLVDKMNKTVKLKRFGNGIDRNFNY